MFSGFATTSIAALLLKEPLSEQVFCEFAAKGDRDGRFRVEALLFAWKRERYSNNGAAFGDLLGSRLAVGGGRLGGAVDGSLRTLVEPFDEPFVECPD